jgi:cytochrome c peroxidase
MQFLKFRWLMTAVLIAGSVLGLQAQDRSILPTKNHSGVAATFSTTGGFDFNNPFFKSLGTNGRSCVTCHQPNEGWGVSAAGVQNRFKESRGRDPIFRPVDGANCPTAVGSKSSIYSLLLSKALIRIDRPLPAGAEFSITVAADPYGCSSSTDISVYRRPLPSTNL